MSPSGPKRWWSPNTRGSLMVCATSSDAGKSLVVTALCAALRRQGATVAPFKGQNMSLNSYVCSDGAEISRAQAAQAMAGGATPEAAMNPVLLKPTGERHSQVMVMGQLWAEVDSTSYQSSKASLAPIVDAALSDIRSRYDVVICEGAGSPAEINLPGPDLVNLGLAQRGGIDALLVADIERGGVFASLAGTLDLLSADQRRLVRAALINKMRGEPELLAPGIAEIERRWPISFCGILPHLRLGSLDAEDSLNMGGFPQSKERAMLDVVVIALPRISNFTDFDALQAEEGVQLRYVNSPALFGNPDLVILPGSKATVADLGWLRATGMATAIAQASRRGSSLLGICAGYQMLGKVIHDGVESSLGTVAGLGLLDATTRFETAKVTRQRRGSWGEETVSGYQIHHGRVVASEEPWLELDDGEKEGAATAGGIWGTTLHGLFEDDGVRNRFLAEVAQRSAKTWHQSNLKFDALRKAQWELLADALEAHVNLEMLAEIMTGAAG